MSASPPFFSASARAVPVSMSPVIVVTANIGSRAFRTVIRTGDAERHIPPVRAGSADEFTFHHIDRSALDDKRLRIDKRVGDLLTRGFDDVPECLTGHSHPQGGGFVIETLVIGKPDRFEFIQSEPYFIEFGHGNAPWLENRGDGQFVDFPAFDGAGHDVSLLMAYANIDLFRVKVKRI